MVTVRIAALCIGGAALGALAGTVYLAHFTRRYHRLLLH